MDISKERETMGTMWEWYKKARELEPMSEMQLIHQVELGKEALTRCESARLGKAVYFAYLNELNENWKEQNNGN